MSSEYEDPVDPAPDGARSSGLETGRARVQHHLAHIYPHLADDEVADLAGRILGAAGVTATQADATLLATPLPGADEVVLITYGDTILAQNGAHLRALNELWRSVYAAAFSTVHVLPFFPSSSDGGFSVIDYDRVDPALGEWSDLAELRSNGAQIIVDLVCNHGSTQSAWFADFIADREPGRSYYRTEDPNADLSAVTRPRTHPLLLPVQTAGGERHVWATFSHDQVDFDFANPDVLVEFAAILGRYLDRGATRVRLDAIAYLWKQLGTRCVHLPQTHHVVKLLRALTDARAPGALLITETNVPHAANVSYFGAGDEAHVVYNFTLAPLICWSVITGRGNVLTRWLDELELVPDGCTFLNFLASHDGIGLRPVEDLITAEQLGPLLDEAIAVGGACSDYATPAGPRPYELNVSLADLLAGPRGETAERFLLAHALMLAVAGIPAIYVHSLFVTPGDHAAVAASGHRRDINRPQLTLAQAQSVLADGWRGATASALMHLAQVRASHTAFAPAAPQVVHDLDPSVVAIERGAGLDRVLALHNVSGEPVDLDIAEVYRTSNLIDGQPVGSRLTLSPWQAAWLPHVRNEHA